MRGMGQLEQILGWLQADWSIRAAWGQAYATVTDGRKQAAEATTTRYAALADTASARSRCSEVVAELKMFHE